MSEPSAAERFQRASAKEEKTRIRSDRAVVSHNGALLNLSLAARSFMVHYFGSCDMMLWEAHIHTYHKSSCGYESGYFTSIDELFITEQQAVEAMSDRNDSYNQTIVCVDDCSDDELVRLSRSVLMVDKNMC